MMTVYVVSEVVSEADTHSVHASLEGAQREVERCVAEREPGREAGATWQRDDGGWWTYEDAEGAPLWHIDERPLMP